MSQVESGRSDGSRVSGIDSPLVQAESAVRLFAALAEKRPEVMNRLLALLEVLVDAPPASANADPQPLAHSELPSPLPLRLTEPVEAEIEIEIEDSLVENSHSAPEPTPAPATTTEAPAAQIVEPKPVREKPKGAVDAKAEAGVAQLLSKFGSPTGGGLGEVRQTPAPAVIRLWDEDAKSARELAGLARAQARRLRKVRLALHASAELPDVDGVLNDARVIDWTAESEALRKLAPKDLREAERWYSVLTKSLVEVADWLEGHSSTPLGHGLTPQALHQRLQAVATAQKGVWCWIDGHLPAIGIDPRMACGVQHAVYRKLADRWTKDFRTKLHHLQMAERITAKDRGAVEDMLARFDLEQAPKASASGPEQVHALAEVGSQSRFDDVADAFDAAARDFGCERLVFTNAAAESAEDSAFKRPDEVYEFFAALRRIADARASGSRNGTPLEADFRSEGFTMKPCSPETMRRNRRHYHINCEVGKIWISHHVTLGSKSQNTCISIHWWHDEENRRFVIGHCGKHLPNTLT